jgi:hypothetical protein
MKERALFVLDEMEPLLHLMYVVKRGLLISSKVIGASALQNRSPIGPMLSLETDIPITALACSGNDVATGSELANHQAVVSVW